MLTDEDKAWILAQIEAATKKRKPPVEKRPNPILLNQYYRWDNITASDTALWKEAYPGVDIDAELAKAASWIKADPSRKKVKWERFINGWLGRAQQNSKGVGAAPAVVQKQKVQCEIVEDRRCVLDSDRKYFGILCCKTHFARFYENQPNNFTADKAKTHPLYSILKQSAAAKRALNEVPV